MKILHLNTEAGFRGGERQLQLLVRGLAGRGHEQVIVGRRGGELLKALNEEGFSTREVDPSGLFGVRSPALVRKLRAVAAEVAPDIVHAHTGNAHTLAVRAFLGRMPVVTTRRVDFSIKKKLSNSKYTSDGQHFIAISNGVRAVLEEGGVPADRIDVVFSGTDAERVCGGDGSRLREEWLGGDGGPLIGFVGALVDHKAPWVLAEAALRVRSELPGARVVFVGEGEERPRLAEIQARAPSAIHLAGWRDDVADCYAALDLFVMPSRLEGLCTALIDALAAGVPAIASRTGGIPDVVVDGETGVLVEPLEAEDLARAMVDLWKDEPRRLAFAAAGRQRFETHFTAEAMVAGTEVVYRKILEKG